MAKLEEMPALDVVDGFKGKLDFYSWNGIICVRAWPRAPSRPRSPAVRASYTLFGQVSTLLSSSSPFLISVAKGLNTGTGWTWRDLMTAAAYGTLIQDGD